MMAGAAGIVAACSSIDCPVENTVSCKYELQKSDGTPDTLNSDTLWVWTPRPGKTDTLLINRLCGGSATAFKLPMSYTMPEDTICLMRCDTTDGLWLDTLWIKKENLPHFESVDCQAAYVHNITAVRTTHSAIDTLIINNSDVTYENSSTPTHLILRVKADR